MSKEKEVKNPQMYGYAHEAEVPVKGGILNEINRLIEPMLEKESRVYYSQIARWYTKDGKPLEGEPTREAIEKDGLVRNLELDKIFNNKNPQIYYTSQGLDLLRLQVMLFKTKSEHIDAGLAKTAAELQGKETPTMEVVK